ncbi:hypothetical protein [Pseudomonas sp. MCal1]|uniref:hypothetical protein n=1 Tax=Pseudomonas sp. MCal1 TaxID=2919887 RepID=UPI002B40C740|nr:hypothetical protein [Pseudomonas sp. MCal1]
MNKYCVAAVLAAISTLTATAVSAARETLHFEVTLTIPQPTVLHPAVGTGLDPPTADSGLELPGFDPRWVQQELRCAA